MSGKIIFTTILLLAYSFVQAQNSTGGASGKEEKKEPKPSIGLGLKVGTNFANVTNASDISASKTTGFLVGLFYAPGSGKQVLGYRTEFIYSKQGYDYKKGASTGTVKLDYILMPQLMTINISKYFEIHAGLQIAFLINAKADSTQQSSTPSNPYGDIMDYYNKFDYGFAGGVEVHPVLGLFVGARYNISFSNLYSSSESSGAPLPPFIPGSGSGDINFKNNVVQLYAGWRF